MSHLDRMIKAAEILEDMAAKIPSHPLLEISAEATAHRAAKSALLDKAHEIRNAVAEAADADLTESD